MFRDSEGGPLRKSKLPRRSYKPLLARAGVDAIPLQSVRHSVLTWLAEKGVPIRAAQAVAGHSTSAMTLAVSQQVTDTLLMSAATAIEHVAKKTARGPAHVRRRCREGTCRSRPPPLHEADRREAGATATEEEGAPVSG